VRLKVRLPRRERRKKRRLTQFCGGWQKRIKKNKSQKRRAVKRKARKNRFIFQKVC